MVNSGTFIRLPNNETNSNKNADSLVSPSLLKVILMTPTCTTTTSSSKARINNIRRGLGFCGFIYASLDNSSKNYFTAEAQRHREYILYVTMIMNFSASLR
jgi:hypothetical protein